VVLARNRAEAPSRTPRPALLAPRVRFLFGDGSSLLVEPPSPPPTFATMSGADRLTGGGAVGLSLSCVSSRRRTGLAGWKGIYAEARSYG
jgi:hypothetical protein